jgi:hypothetical protein
MINQMAADKNFFARTCSSLLERMINTVPRNVVLTDVITFREVKPMMWDIMINDDGTMTVYLQVRVSVHTPSWHFGPDGGLSR